MNIHAIKKMISDAFKKDRSYMEGVGKLGWKCLSLGNCPKCGNKNEPKLVLTGVCAYCTYDINKNKYLEEE